MKPTRTTAMVLAFGACQFLATTLQAQTDTASPSQTAPHSNAGKYERVIVHGPSLMGNLEGDSPDRQVSVYLPPSYGHAPARRYAVLYLLHGFTDSDSRWFGLKGHWFVNVPEAADRAYESGVHEMIIVMPDAFTRYEGSMYSNSVTTGDWESFIARDLVAYVDKHYRTIAAAASRGLAGHSMGGYGTLRIGMKHPGVFSSLYAQSPCCLAANLEPSAELFARVAAVSSPDQFAAADFATKAMMASAAAWSPNPGNAPRYFDLPIDGGKPVPQVIAIWAANAPLAMVHQYIPGLRSYNAIAIDAGDHDTAIAQSVRSLDMILTGYKVSHVAEIYAGDHVNRIGERLQTKVLPFFSAHLKSR